MSFFDKRMLVMFVKLSMNTPRSRDMKEIQKCQTVTGKKIRFRGVEFSFIFCLFGVDEGEGKGEGFEKVQLKEGNGVYHGRSP